MNRATRYRSECIPYEIEEKVDTYMYTLTRRAVQCLFYLKMPLKLIPKCLSPDLLYVLASMGHGDEIGKVERFIIVNFFLINN